MHPVPGRARCRCTICWTKSSGARQRRRDLAKLEELCDMVKSTSLCGLGQTAPNPTLSTLRFFRNEYEELLRADPGGPPGNGELKQPSAPAAT